MNEKFEYKIINVSGDDIEELRKEFNILGKCGFKFKEFKEFKVYGGIKLLAIFERIYKD